MSLIMSCAYSYIPILIRPDNNYYFVGDCHSKHMFIEVMYTCTCPIFIRSDNLL